jgi:hypothetical protein
MYDSVRGACDKTHVPTASPVECLRLILWTAPTLDCKPKIDPRLLALEAKIGIERLLRRIEITRAESRKNLAGSKNMALHCGDHRRAFCLGRIEV